MGSISPDPASELLDLCLSGRRWSSTLLDQVLQIDGGRPLFRIVAEGLGDLFEPRLCDVYADLFSEVIARFRPELSAGALRQRFEKIRQVRACDIEPSAVYVLSRVTLGADAAVTSVILDAAKQRFPQAAIYFVGARKNYELFAADPHIRHLHFEYPRSGGVIERLSVWPRIDDPDAMVIDPDSRLSQLGLLPVCKDSRYFFFESRAYGTETTLALSSLAADWAQRVFGITVARAYIAPEAQGQSCDIAVSLGVGENAEKRVSHPFERRLLELLNARGGCVIVDAGAGGEETERVRAAADGLRNVVVVRGDFAAFAATIASSRLYVGYDSAGQHVAAASGIPLIDVFNGYRSRRMFQRWSPSGPGKIQIIDAAGQSAEAVLRDISAAL